MNTNSSKVDISSDQQFGSLSDLKAFLEPLLREFQDDIGYTGPRPGNDYSSLLQGMHEQACKTGVPYPKGSRSWHSFKTGFFHTYRTYPHQPLEVRIFTAVFTWLGSSVDDIAVKSPEDWHDFVHRFHTGQEHSTPLAQAWADHLRKTYIHFSHTAANFIINSALNATNATVLAGSALGRMTRTSGGENWPYYLREKDGVSEAYIWFTFPATLYPDVSCFMEAIPDMTKYILFSNDILSFYKEEIAGDRDNYVYGRAFYTKKNVSTVLRETVKETVDAFRRIETVLRGRGLYLQAWQDYAMGSISFHKSTDRYKLSELGLAEEYTHELAELANL